MLFCFYFLCCITYYFLRWWHPSLSSFVLLCCVNLSSKEASAQTSLSLLSHHRSHYQLELRMLFFEECRGNAPGATFSAVPTAASVPRGIAELSAQRTCSNEMATDGHVLPAVVLGSLLTTHVSCASQAQKQQKQRRLDDVGRSCCRSQQVIEGR